MLVLAVVLHLLNGSAFVEASQLQELSDTTETTRDRYFVKALPKLRHFYNTATGRTPMTDAATVTKSVGKIAKGTTVADLKRYSLGRILGMLLGLEEPGGGSADTVTANALTANLVEEPGGGSADTVTVNALTANLVEEPLRAKLVRKEEPVAGSKKCTKYTTTGWHEGEMHHIYQLPSGTTWQECAQKCAEFSSVPMSKKEQTTTYQCGRWTFNSAGLEGHTNCMMQAGWKGAFHEEKGYSEGDNNANCIAAGTAGAVQRAAAVAAGTWEPTTTAIPPPTPDAQEATADDGTYLFLSFCGGLGNAMFQYASALGIAAQFKGPKKPTVCFVDYALGLHPVDSEPAFTVMYPGMLWGTVHDQGKMKKLAEKRTIINNRSDWVFPQLSYNQSGWGAGQDELPSGNPCSKAVFDVGTIGCEYKGWFVRCPNTGSKEAEYNNVITIQEKAGNLVKTTSVDNEVIHLADARHHPPYDFLAQSHTRYARFDFYSFLQSWRFFWAIREKIRREFTFHPTLVSEAKRIVSKHVPDRAGTFVVILHERSGDMGSGALDKMGCPATGFYPNVLKHYREKNAMLYDLYAAAQKDNNKKKKKKKKKKIVFLVVAQNPALAAKHPFFKDDPGVIVLPQAPLKNRVLDQAHHWPNMIRDEPLDLAIMQQGDAMVVSVGTYSWWGGFLNGNDNEVAYCRESREALLQFNATSSPYFPDEWIAISAASRVEEVAAASTAPAVGSSTSGAGNT
jgi:hypothetical protein